MRWVITSSAINTAVYIPVEIYIMIYCIIKFSVYLPHTRVQLVIKRLESNLGPRIAIASEQFAEPVGQQGPTAAADCENGEEAAAPVQDAHAFLDPPYQPVAVLGSLEDVDQV